MGIRPLVRRMLSRIGCTGSTRFPFIKRRELTYKNVYLYRFSPPPRRRVPVKPPPKRYYHAYNERPAAPVVPIRPTPLPTITVTPPPEPVYDSNYHGETDNPNSTHPSRHSLAPQPPDPCFDDMDIKVVKEVTSTIDRVFGHIHYTVTGLSAMTFYGFQKRLPKKVNIVFPDHARRVVEGWAVAHGIPKLVTQGPDLYGVTTSEGHVRCVRFRYCRNFKRLHIYRDRIAGRRSPKVNVLGLQSIADDVARAYVRALKAGDPVSEQNALADLILWVLRRLVDTRDPAGRVLFTKSRTPHILHESFWEPFTLAYPVSLPLFYEVGVRWPRDRTSQPLEPDEPDIPPTVRIQPPPHRLRDHGPLQSLEGKSGPSIPIRTRPSSDRSKNNKSQQSSHQGSSVPRNFQPSSDRSKNNKPRQNPRQGPASSIPIISRPTSDRSKSNSIQQSPDSGLGSSTQTPSPGSPPRGPVRVESSDPLRRPTLRRRSLRGRPPQPYYTPREAYELSSLRRRRKPVPPGVAASQT